MATKDQAQHFTVCKMCEGPVEFICFPCEIKLCGNCSLNHMRTKSKRGHELREYSRSVSHQCDMHPSVVSEFYCKSCFVPLCTECIITNDHKLHDLSSMSSITALFETLIEEESTELRTKVKVNFEKRIEDLKTCLTAVNKHCQIARNNIIQWGEKCKREITILVESLQQKIESAEIEATQILKEQTDQIERNILDIQDTLKDYEEVKMSENSKLIVSFQSQIDQLSILPVLKMIYVPKFAPSFASLQAGIGRVFGDLNLVLYRIDKEFTNISQIRTSKEIFSVVNQKHGNILGNWKNQYDINQYSTGSLQRCQVPLHPELLFSFQKWTPFQKKVESILTDLKARPLWSESKRDSKEAYLMIQSTSSIAHWKDIRSWKESVTKIMANYLSEWRVDIISVPGYLRDTMAEKLKTIWIPNPNNVGCHLKKTEKEIYVIGIGEHTREVTSTIRAALSDIQS